VGVTPVKTHRSRQLREHDLDADLIVGLAREHVAYVRRVHPEAAPHTATLRRLVSDLPHSPGALTERVASLGLADVELQPWEDVEDPAGGDLDVFVTCARELVHLITELASPSPEA
jgi:protein-tyrosine-phosphatase